MWQLLPGLLVLALPIADARGDVPPVVQDAAGLFGVAARERAARLIEEIRQEFAIDLRVETVGELNGMDSWRTTRGQREWLREQAQKRADAYRIDRGVFQGLYLLIVQRPSPRVSVVGWPADLEQDVYSSRYKRDLLRSDLEKGLSEDADTALLRGLDRYRALLIKDRRLGPSPLPALPALAIVGGLFAAWVVLRLVRSRLAGANQPAPLYPAGMLGSLFGAPSAFWLYDQLYNAERPVAPAAAAVPEPPDEQTPLPAEPPVGEGI